MRGVVNLLLDQACLMKISGSKLTVLILKQWFLCMRAEQNQIDSNLNIILFYEGRIIMTLVFRSPKLLDTISNQNPGPGAYKITQNLAPNSHPTPSFISKVQKYSKTIEETDVGPTKYFRQFSSFQAKCENNLSVFKSKVDRFRQDSSNKGVESKQKQFMNEFNELMKKQRGQNGRRGKLIDSKKKKQIQQKMTEMQNLPSIPSVQHSFGYRIDQHTNKLVSNYNPKIIFTQTIKNDSKQDFYFQRTHQIIGGKTFTINPTSKRTQNHLAHQISNPNINNYDSNKYFTIQNQSKKAKKQSHSNCNIDRFGNCSPSKKQMLKLNKIRRQFESYIHSQNINIDELQNSKLKKQFEHKSTKANVKTDVECFLSKQPRFQSLIKNQDSTSKIQLTLKSSKVTQNKLRNSISSQQAKKQPFKLGIQRFKSGYNEKLGPGSYDLKQSAFSKGVSLKQNEQRFREKPKNIQNPGPGSYDLNVFEVVHAKQKINFNKYRNNAYFNQLNSNDGRLKTMEDLYQQVGKHMNYLNKIQKLQTKKKQNKGEGKKVSNYLNLDRIEEAKKILKAKLGKNLQQKDQKQNKVKQQLKAPNYNHLYNYTKPPLKASQIGPGYYQVATSLDKKTFNKTVNI